MTILSIMEDETTVQDFELNDEGACTSCKEVSLEHEFVPCGICQRNFHVVCTAATADDKWATKSMMLTFKSPSTKCNFKFFCDCCQTTWETNRADIDGQRLRKMERNMEVISKELLEIKKLVSDSINTTIAPGSATPTVDPNTQSTSEQVQPTSNIWQDQHRLASVKAKPQESILVINKAADTTVDKTNTELVENMVIESRIPVTKSFKDKSGNLVVVCESKESRDALKNQVSESNNTIEMKTPTENRSVVSIVGFSRNYEKEEVVDLLQKQNYFLGQFSESNNIKDHINIFAVKPLRDKPDVYQAFARISKLVRQGFKTFNDKVTLGLSSCKIYDQYHVKRCNNCQGFGHFYKDCTSPDTHICAKCGENHSTKDCTSSTVQCTNCVKAEVPLAECNHRCDDSGCPTLRKQQEKIKNNLNLQR